MNQLSEIDDVKVEDILYEFGDIENSIADIQHKTATPLCTEMLCGLLDSI